MLMALIEFCYKASSESKKSKVPMSDAMKNKARLALSGGRDIDRIVHYPDTSALWDFTVEDKLAALWALPALTANCVKTFKNWSKFYYFINEITLLEEFPSEGAGLAPIISPLVFYLHHLNSFQYSDCLPELSVWWHWGCSHRQAL